MLSQWRLAKLSMFDRRHSPDYGALTIEAVAGCAGIHAQSFSVGWSEAEFEKLLLERTTQADCAINGPSHTVCGFVISRIAADEAEILTIAVAHRYRKLHIGRTLLGEHISRLNRRAVRHVFLEVAEDNEAALKLYHRAGFNHVGARKSYYPKADGGRVSALVLKLTID